MTRAIVYCNAAEYQAKIFEDARHYAAHVTARDTAFLFDTQSFTTSRLKDAKDIDVFYAMSAPPPHSATAQRKAEIADDCSFVG